MQHRKGSERAEYLDIAAEGSTVDRIRAERRECDVLVTKAVSDIIDSAIVSRLRFETLWTQYQSVFTEIAELVATQLMLSKFEDLGYADRKAVLSRTEIMIKSWAASGSHLRRSRDGVTPIKDALDRICHLADEIALLESIPRGARQRP